MSKETQRSSDRFDWDAAAADALEQARLMAPGPARNEALNWLARFGVLPTSGGWFLPSAAGHASRLAQATDPGNA